MKKLIYSTNIPPPENDEDSLYAKFYKKHDFKNIFDSYLAWGPTILEFHCHVTPGGRKLIVNSMYYIHEKSKEKAPFENLEVTCDVFGLTCKRHKNTK